MNINENHSRIPMAQVGNFIPKCSADVKKIIQIAICVGSLGNIQEKSKYLTQYCSTSVVIGSDRRVEAYTNTDNVLIISHVFVFM